MSTKRIVFVGLLFVLMLFIVGCSPAEVSEEQIQNDVTSSAPEWDTDAVIDSFTIVRRTPNEEEKTEKVHVKIDGKTDLLYSLRYYTLSYFYSKDEGWMLSDIEAENEDLWETKPLAGPDTSLAKRALTDKYLYVNNDKWNITEETIKEIKIDKNDAILENLQASMNCTVILENDFVTVTGTASVEYQFDPECVINTEKKSITKDGWYVSSYSFSDDYVYEFKSEMRPVLTNEQVLSYMDTRRFLFNDSYNKSQHVWMTIDNINGLTVDSLVPINKGSQCIFTGEFTYFTDLATFSVKYNIPMSYDTESKIWNWDDIEYESECLNITLPKNWSGTYNDGTMGVDLTLTSIKANGDLEAIYSFYPMPGNTSGKSGSYKMTGSYNPKTLEIDLRGSEWIERPSWYSYANIAGIIKVDNSSIISNNNDFIVFTKSFTDNIKESYNICDELNYLSDVQVLEINKAISYIKDKYGLDFIIVITSTTENCWDYLVDTYDVISSAHEIEECGLFVCNVGDKEYRGSFQYGYVGDLIVDYTLSDSVYDYFQTDTMRFDKMIQEYLLSVNRFLGGTDSDLTFSW